MIEALNIKWEKIDESKGTLLLVFQVNEINQFTPNLIQTCQLYFIKGMNSVL